MRHYALAICCLGIAISPVSAFAGVVIERAGAGRDCYEATLLQSTSINDQLGLLACNRAVEDTGRDAYNQAAAFVNRADIHLRMKNFQDAVDDSEKGIALSPAMPAAYLNRGAGLVGLKRYEEAISMLDKAVALGIEHPQFAFFNRAMAKESLGDIPGAYHDYKMASEIDPKFTLASEELTRFQVASPSR